MRWSQYPANDRPWNGLSSRWDVSPIRTTSQAASALRKTYGRIGALIGGVEVRGSIVVSHVSLGIALDGRQDESTDDGTPSRNEAADDGKSDERACRVGNRR